MPPEWIFQTSSKIESGRALLKVAPTDIRDLVESCVERLAPQARQKNLDLAVEVPASLCTLADPDQAARVLTNLLHNAIKFTPNDGRVVITAQRTGEPDAAWVQVKECDSD